MDVFRQWAVCLIVAAAAGTFVTAISPGRSVDKTVRAVVGIFVVAAICAPIQEIKNAGISELAFAEYDYPDSSDKEKEMYDYMLSVCKSAVEDETIRLSDEYKTVIESIEADMYIDENNCIIIQNIQIGIQPCDDEIISSFSKKLSENLGVTVTVIEK